MSVRRELVTGLLAALLSVIVIGGALSISLAEDNLSIAMVTTSAPPPSPTPTPSATLTKPPTATPIILAQTAALGAPTATITPSPLPTRTPSETIPPTPETCPPPPGWQPITVGPGDTLESLAQRYNVSVDTLAQGNCLMTTRVFPGTILYVPPLPYTATHTPFPTSTTTPKYCGPPQGWVLYTIQPGDTLYSLSQAFGVSVSQLKNANCLTSNLIRAGDTLYVPNIPTRTPTRTPRDTATKTPIPPTITNTPIPTTSTPPTSTPTPSPTPTSSPTETLTPTTTDTQPPSTPTPTPTGSSTPTMTPIPITPATPTFTPTKEGG